MPPNQFHLPRITTSMFNLFKRQQRTYGFEAFVSPEADTLLAEARTELNPKHDAMEKNGALMRRRTGISIRAAGLFKTNPEHRHTNPLSD